jgi:RNA polymerase sigma-70 factor (ECF subfamily)
MPADDSFRDLIRRVRGGDDAAATELVRLYEPTIRLVVRRRLYDPSLRRHFDSVDICQSVLASFFVRAAMGQYVLETPDQLLKLLSTMARNKLVDQVGKQRAAQRDHRLQQEGGRASDLVDPHRTPSQVAANRDLLEQVRRRLTDEERQLADLRGAGREWADIAKEVGGTADGVRMRLSRALDRVSQEMGLEG